METFVLIPEQLSLERAGDGRLGVVSNEYISRGTRFSPFQGTLRTDQFASHSAHGTPRERRHRHHNATPAPVAESWIKYLRQSTSHSSPDVNLTEIIIPGGQILYEVRRSIQPLEELVVYVRIESVLSFTRALKDVIFEETLRALILEVPLDLSTSIFNSSTSAKTNRQDLVRTTKSKSKTKSEASSDDIDTEESDADASSSSSSLNLNKALALEISSKSSSSTSSSLTGSSVGVKRVRSLLPCGVCSKSFDRPSLLKRHMRTHTGEKPHRCECGKAFSTSSSLNTHRRIHSGEKPHQCPVCGKRFTASSNLYYHRMTHVKEKPHKCLLCGKSFPTPGDLKSHGFIHTGSWPFKCSVCSRGFSKQTNLKNHLFLHTGNKPHGCNLCHKKFALACNFRAHLKTHQDSSSELVNAAYQGM